MTPTPTTTTLFAAMIAAPLAAADLDPEGVAFFEEKIRPALVTYCYECHSVKSGVSRAGLLVDTRDGLLTGGDSGPAITPGEFEDNLLWDAVTWSGYEMPPDQKMPAEVIEDFRRWIEMGAPDPREVERAVFVSKITPEDVEAGKDHWAFRPVDPPAGATIDSLVNAKLREAGLKPAEPAGGATLLRRLHFDLTGLPPSPEDVERFRRAWSRDRDAAVEAKVEELLASDRFGERWGRHWLDAARYADSSGGVNVAYPHAWRYRDYVIDSLNADKPYDRFVREQVAGDLLPAGTDAERQENLIATGFLAVGKKRHGERNPRSFAADLVDEQIDAVTQSVLGLTVSCARCHDHRSDPIPTADYYALAGIFRSTDTLYGTHWGQQNHRPAELLLLPVADAAEGPAESIADLTAQKRRLQDQMRRMNIEARRSGERVQKDFVQMRNRIAAVEARIADLNPDGSRKTFGMGVRDGEPVDASILLAGNFDRPAQAVPRGFLSVLGDVPHAAVPADASGRRELADWLTSAENPLTARVMANRVWGHLFGSPLVGTPNNWGPSGLRPTHPELLDHLAGSFVADGWSVKSLVRRIVLSDAYRRGSGHHADNGEKDPDNTLLWRMSPRHLDAESLRDAMLAAGGNLDLSRPEPAIEGTGRVDRGRGSDARQTAQNEHRSVYLPVIRDAVHESLDLFGFPDPNAPSEGRRESIAATQALYMLNGEFALEQAGEMAERVEAAAGDDAGRVSAAYFIAYGRPPTDSETAAGVRFIAEMNAASPSGGGRAAGRPAARGPRANGMRSGGQRPGGMRPGGGPRGRRPDGPANRPAAAANGLQLFCQCLLASAEFRILD